MALNDKQHRYTTWTDYYKKILVESASAGVELLNNACDDLAIDCLNYRKPIKAARRHLEGSMKRDLDRALHALPLGSMPNLVLPPALSELEPLFWSSCPIHPRAPRGSQWHKAP